ncbi:DUF7281 domain-containing protein [Nitrincola alkalilacustris]|uniref:DUF7281 domain-containing protein n=1 Tax=Nitrincola alkalilacustris TaxID=1571224 RepID=UPI00124DC559|nr:DUF2399 domain-containing protein [Nitrincola alkalilacustris]
MSRTLQSALLRLLQAENQQLSLSQLTAGQRRALDDFCTRTGAAMQQRQGRGSVYRVLNRAVVEQHLNDMGVLSEPDSELPQRSINIARSRSSKSGRHAHALTYLLAKGVNGATWLRDDDEVLNLEYDTQRQGAGVFTLGEMGKDEWVTSGSLWLVENQALFDHLDWLPEHNPATLVWYRGQLQNTVIEWLAKRQRAASVILFPDYDGVGLQNYLRLKQRLGRQVQFWLMPNWEQKLKLFGSNELWRKSAEEFESAVRQIQQLPLGDEVEVMALMRAMQTSGLALEQEAVWLTVNEG